MKIWILMRTPVPSPLVFPVCRAFTSYFNARLAMGCEHEAERLRGVVDDNMNRDTCYVARTNAHITFKDGRRISWTIKEVEVEDGNRDTGGRQDGDAKDREEQ